MIPSADVEGFDASAKAAILASLAFDADVVAGDVYREGIDHVELSDIDFARRLGYEVKLLAVRSNGCRDPSGARHRDRGHPGAPAMLPVGSIPSAGVRGPFNASLPRGCSTPVSSCCTAAVPAADQPPARCWAICIEVRHEPELGTPSALDQPGSSGHRSGR